MLVSLVSTLSTAQLLFYRDFRDDCALVNSHDLCYDRHILIWRIICAEKDIIMHYSKWRKDKPLLRHFWHNNVDGLDYLVCPVCLIHPRWAFNLLFRRKQEGGTHESRSREHFTSKSKVNAYRNIYIVNILKEIKLFRNIRDCLDVIFDYYSN